MNSLSIQRKGKACGAWVFPDVNEFNYISALEMGYQQANFQALALP